MDRRQSFLKGALIISLGGFISKILGAFYRIPLTHIIGSEGMGIYQMVYPLYCILLTLSASGIPSGIARLISSGEVGAEKEAFRLYGVIGLLGSILMFFLADSLAFLQGEEAISLCTKLLSPSVFAVSYLSVVRGYFQGKSNMYPTAVTEVLEQLIKVVSGCLLAYIFRSNFTLSVASTLLAVTISELAATIIAFIWYKKRQGVVPLYRVTPPKIKSILHFTIPLTLTALALPLSHLVESVVIVRLLRMQGLDATSLFGIFSGCALTLVNLPPSVTYGLAASSIPQISPLSKNGEFKKAKSKVYKSVLITLGVSAFCAVMLYLFSPLAVKIVFSSLSEENKELTVQLCRIMAISAVTQSVTQTTSACLTALGKPLISSLTQWGTAILRVVLTFVLIRYTNMSLIGAAVSLNIAYFLAAFLNMCYIICINKRKEQDENNTDRLGIASRRLKRKCGKVAR